MGKVVGEEEEVPTFHNEDIEKGGERYARI